MKSGQVVFAKTRCELKCGVAVTLDKGSNAVIESLSRFYVVIKKSEKLAKVIWSSLRSDCLGLVTQAKSGLSEFQ